MSQWRHFQKENIDDNDGRITVFKIMEFRGAKEVESLDDVTTNPAICFSAEYHIS